MTSRTEAPAGVVVLDAPTSVAEFRFEHVGKTFTTDTTPFVAVDDIDLEIEAGTFVAIVGPSGCGKSTLLNMAAGLMEPTTGRVWCRGDEVDGVSRDGRVGYMTQSSDLLPWYTLERNVALPLEIARVPRRERKERVRAVLEQVGLAGFERRYPIQLSGGMQRRAAIARTLVYGPSTLLMDEPFGALDAQLRRVLQHDLLDLWEHDKKTVLFVTHDLEEAILLADRVVVFGSAPGRILTVEPVSFDRPREISELRRAPEFGEFHERLWALLEPEVGR